MKHLTFSKNLIIASFLTFNFLLSTFNSSAQAPQSFQYQAVVRDNGGVAMPTQNVGFQLSIISGSPTGTVEYVETHSVITNAFGVVTLSVGTGTTTDNFLNINWGSATHFLKVETDLGSGYVEMGTTQLLSVPYALYAETAGNAGQTYTAGNGINITGNVIDNTAPDQVVNLNGTGATSVTGTYPNFTINSVDNVNDADADPINEIQTLGIAGQTLSISSGNSVTIPATTYTAGSGINVAGTVISNTLPDQTIAITGSGATSVSGTYPNFTVTSTDNNTTYSAGTGMNLTGTTFNAQTTSALWNANQLQSTSVSSTVPTSNQVLKYNGASWAPAADVNTTYTAGSGINVAGTVISNTAPDQTVAITGGGATSVSGTYPNFNITSTDNNTTYTAGTGLSLSGTTINSVWSTNGNHIYNNNTENVGVGINNPVGRMVVQGSPTALATDPLFEVKNSLGQSVFVVWQDSVQVYINDDAIMSNRGGFAVSGRNMSKAFTNNYLKVTPDSSRIWTKNPLAGFGVQSINGITKANYMKLTPDNYFIGHESGININVGGGGLYNNCYGYQAGLNITTGVNNNAIGYQALYFNTTGNYNVANGFEALNNNTIGSYNVANGNQALFYNTSGAYNVANGFMSLFSNTSGNSNVANGNQTLLSNTTGYNNTATGNTALYSNTTGYQNVANGNEALFSNTTGFNNAANGNQALRYNISGSYNVANGFQALFNNNASYNVANGYQALYSNSVGNYNVANGYQALYTNNNNSNVANGYLALYFNSTGDNNTAEGYQAMYKNTTGRTNVAIGSNALWSNTTFNANVAIGDQAAYYAVGGANTAIGQWSLFYNTGSNNTALGFGAFYSWTPTNYANSTALGYQAMITASNQVRVGTTTVTSIGGYAGWTTLPSDKRFKKNITENVPGLSFITRLRPVTYYIDMDAIAEFTQMPDSLRLKEQESLKVNNLQTGFIAQEVEEAANDVGFDFCGVDKPKNKDDFYGLRYAEFTVPLVKAVQELNNKNVLLENEVEELKLENKSLRSLIEKMQQDIEVLKTK